MAKPILVFCEQREGRLKRVGLEALGQACRLSKASGSTVVAIVVGSSVDSLTQELTDHGASRIVVAEDPALAYYSSELFTTIMADIARRLEPVAILMGATAMGKDLAPKLAARLKSALIQDCVALEMEADGSLVATRPIYGGKLRAVVKARKPTMQI